jgi:hypothetical protein
LRGLGTGDTERRAITPRNLQRFIETQLWERDAQAERFTLLGRIDDATQLRTEADVIARYQIPER